MMHALSIQLDPNPNDIDLHMVERMASVIAKHLQEKHSCSIDDLLSERFSQEDINRYWGDANKLAEKKRPRPNWSALKKLIECCAAGIPRENEMM